MNDLELAIALSKQLENSEYSGRSISGRLSQSEYENLRQALVQSDLEHSYDRKTEQLAFKLPSRDVSVFAKNLTELLSAPSRQVRVPAEFYLADIDYHHTEDSQPPSTAVQQYLDTAKFVQEILKVADHSVLQGRVKAIFLHGQKIELTLGYGVEDLRPLTGCIEFYSEFVNAEIHKNQKASIIKSVLIEMLKTNELDRLTLPCLLKRFPEFVDRVNANYQLYVSEFSFEKIRDQVEKEKLDFMLKLNKVFSEIQNQLLAIPVALILVGSQIKPAETITFNNTAIFCGMLVFAFLMSLLLRNQNNSLQSIKIEMTSQWNGIKNKHLLTSEKLRAHYDDLKNRYNRQKTSLRCISFIISLSVLASTANFVYSTEQLLTNYDIIIKYGISGGLIAFALYKASILSFTAISKIQKNRCKKSGGKSSPDQINEEGTVQITPSADDL